MKKLVACMCILVLLLCCAGAQADGGDRFGLENMPNAVKTIIENSAWSAANGWEITGWAYPNARYLSGACAFAAVKKGSRNDLLAFGFSSKTGEYSYKWHNASALPQGTEPIMLYAANEGAQFRSYYVTNGGSIGEADCAWRLADDGTWRLGQVYSYDPLMFIDTSVAGVMHMSNVGWTETDIDVKIYGTYQTNLRYFNFASFPLTVTDARAKLSNPPKIPAGTLTAKKIQFTSGQKFKVYQGPGEEYGQAGEGKAVVSTNDWIQVFGEENGWIFIQYDITSDHMRMGWIPASALPKKAAVTELVFAPVASEMTRAAVLTDDPLFSKMPVGTILEGARVEWLASMGDWAYIEIAGNAPLRGFVPADAVAALMIEEKD